MVTALISRYIAFTEGESSRKANNLGQKACTLPENLTANSKVCFALHKASCFVGYHLAVLHYLRFLPTQLSAAFSVCVCLSFVLAL